MEEAANDPIRTELSPGEELLWAGQPRQGFVLRAADVFFIPFSLLWGGFAIFWEVGVLASGAPWFFALWGVPFVLAGLYIIFGRFWVEARQRARTYYAVTPERILIISGLFARRVNSLNIDTLSDVSLTERGDGSGTIAFGPTSPYSWWFGSAAWQGFGQYGGLPCFELIGDARHVYETVRGAQRAARHSASHRSGDARTESSWAKGQHSLGVGDEEAIYRKKSNPA